MTKYQKYEIEKQKIVEESKTCKEYERKIKELVRRFNLWKF